MSTLGRPCCTAMFLPRTDKRNTGSSKGSGSKFYCIDSLAAKYTCLSIFTLPPQFSDAFGKGRASGRGFKLDAICNLTTRCN